MAATSKEQKPKRGERPYSEADVRECLNKMLDQYELDLEVESAYAIANEAKWPQMRSVVRVLGAFCPACTRPPSRQHPTSIPWTSHALLCVLAWANSRMRDHACARCS